ncbi:MAG: DUF2088 domain-containing protein [Desulfobacteraceae bacterium]|nr:DUF2088 domain-containing protein [Desulfobacteraceae bacterium]
MRYPKYIEDDFSFPDFYRVQMNHPRRGLEDPVKALHDSLDDRFLTSHIKKGDSVAIGVGSRGIANIAQLVTALCERFKEFGAIPHIIPAMGSHGSATAQGQVKVLEKLGITETVCGAPVVSSMDVVRVGEVMGEVPVYFSRDALAMDHSVCINRIKPHTKFKGSVESGLCKMLCVGMGKHQGALAYHNMALKHGFFPLLKSMAERIMFATNFRFGIAVVEDHFEDTMVVEPVPAGEVFERESRLLELARDNFPHLPFSELDALVIREIGKDISGSGMDPNVTGRTYDLMEDDFSGILRAGRIAILNLSEKTAGNAIGLGNADIITEKVFRGLDYESTVMNALTSISLRKAFIPIRLPDDQKAIQAALTTLGPLDPALARAVIIKDTLHTQAFWASQALLPEVEAMAHAEVMEKKRPAFDGNGDLILP